MRITVTTGIYPPDIGGPAKFIPAFANYLYRKGIGIEIITLENSKDQVHPKQMFSVDYVLRNQPRLKRIFSTVKLIIKSLKKSEIIFSNGLYEESAISLLICSKNGVAKIVGDPIWERYSNQHENSESIENFNTNRLSLKWKLQEYMLIKSLNRFDHVFYPSEQLKKIFIKKGLKIPQSVIPNGIKCHNVIETNHEYDVITVSRLTKWKNLDKLIEACSIANLSLAIVGDGPEEQNLKLCASKSNAKVSFLGKIPNEEISDVLRLGNIFALISSYEGMSFALLEAMMSGKAIITSNISGNSTIIKNGENGILVDSNNIEDIAMSLKRLNNNKREAISYGIQANKDAKKNYCEEIVYNKIYDLIKRNI